MGQSGAADAPSDAVTWLRALFADVGLRAPHGLPWTVDGAEPPLRLQVALATDGPVADMVLRDDGPLARIGVAEQVQRHAAAGWGVSLPPCPHHGVALVPVRSGDDVWWHCPHGDADCPVGDYDELLWPPRPADAAIVPVLLGRRWRRRAVHGVARWNVADGVVRVTAHEGADEAALREAADPFVVTLEWIPPVGWARRSDPDGETLVVTNAAMHLARIEGTLGRSPTGDLQVGEVALRLSFDHRLGPPGGPLLLDADGVAFADEGDRVACGGGFTTGGPVRQGPRVFVAGQITRLGRPRR